MADDFAARVAGVAALAEPVRRELYLFVVAQTDPVSRDQASAGTGVARHTAKFHLDRLVDDGLLETDFKQLSGRRGPGAGRPSKVYSRSSGELSVSLPERRYDLAGALMAQAIDDSVRDELPVLEALRRAAAQAGRRIVDDHEPREQSLHGEALVAATCESLAALGYEPRTEDDTITLANCPFHALVGEHTELVCGMNLSLVGAVAESLGDGDLTARLDPGPDRCCVVLSPS